MPDKLTKTSKDIYELLKDASINNKDSIAKISKKSIGECFSIKDKTIVDSLRYLEFMGFIKKMGHNSFEVLKK